MNQARSVEGLPTLTNRRVKNVKNLTPLGKMTLFYIPSHKLDVPGPSSDTPRAQIHDFLIRHYKAYTHTPSPVKGFWLSEARTVQHDVLERFEVSFESEKAFRQLVDFLIGLSDALCEEAVYLTRGEESFLVRRRRSPS